LCYVLVPNEYIKDGLRYYPNFAATRLVYASDQGI